MYAAFNNNNELVYASRVDTYDMGPWSCPKCQQKLVLKTSSRGKNFFSHLIPCGKGYIERDHGGESLSHQNFKAHISWSLDKFGIDHQLEYILDTSDQIADIYIDEYKLALEFQHTPLAARELEDRNELYHRQNCHAIWIIDSRQLKDRFSSAWKKAVLQYHPSIGYYWLGYEESSLSFLFHHQVPLLYQGQKTSCLATWVSLKEDWFNLLVKLKRSDGFSLNSRNQIFKKINFRTRPYQRQLLGLKRNKSNQKELQDLYRYGLIIDELPEWILLENWQTLIFEGSGVFTLAWAYVALKQLGRDCGSFSFVEFKKIIQSILNKGFLTMNKMPLLNQSPLDDFLWELLALFEKKSLVKKLREDYWLVEI